MHHAGKAWAAMVNDNHPDAARYMQLAAEAYSSASMMTDAASQAVMIKIASAYMRLARLVREREDDEHQFRVFLRDASVLPGFALR